MHFAIIGTKKKNDGLDLIKNYVRILRFRFATSVRSHRNIPQSRCTAGLTQNGSKKIRYFFRFGIISFQLLISVSANEKNSASTKAMIDKN